MPIRARLFESLATQDADEQRARELERFEREITRAHRRLLCETLLGCVGCAVLGLYLVGWAVHTTDGGMGRISLWVGLLAGDGGMIAFLVRYFRGSEENGSP